MKYLREVFIRNDAKYELPKNGVILDEVTSFYDMDGIVHVAYIIRFSDDTGVRIAGFDAKTHEYLGEALPSYL